MMNVKDRLTAILTSTNTTLNGIDFVEIASVDQKTLRVHFLNGVQVEGSIQNVTISGGETIATVPILNLNALQNHINEDTFWTIDGSDHCILTLQVNAPGDFSTYTLMIDSPVLDRLFQQVSFSFKALCPSDQDCATAVQVCPAPSGEMPPIDYLAKDFLSFRNALSDFSTLLYPDWQERSEADFGVMFMEALCSLADDLSYTQDRIAAEAMLETATQRRSLLRLARLVDYEPQPVLAARVLLQFDVQDGTSTLPSGLAVSAQGPDGQPIVFETGTSLVDPQSGKRNQRIYPVKSTWNRGSDPTYNLVPYYWDDSQRCLPAGSTEMWIVGHDFQFVTDEIAGKGNGQALLIDTQGSTPADPHICEIVHLVSAEEQIDQLFNGQAVTHIIWSSDEALQFAHDLSFDDRTPPRPRTVLAGNLIPATQGRRYQETFAIDTSPIGAASVPLAIVRTGPNNTPDIPSLNYLYTLQNARLAWLAQDALDALPLPEIILEQLPLPSSTQVVDWTWRRRLLDSESFENAFMVEPARFVPVARNSSDGSTLWDYTDDNGDTIRFGDGVFGELPPSGATFQITYRVGGGTVGNVTANSLVNVDPTAAQVLRVTNPFVAQGGADEETAERIQRLAPQSFRAQQFRAVRSEDYVDAAKRLPWVFRAGTNFRWTGSWLTVFTTADPQDAEALSIDQHTDLINLLNRYRLAGYESYAPLPHDVALDLLIVVCARSDAFRGDVEAAIIQALSTRAFPDGTTGFFFFDNFTFGTPLERSALEAALQRAYGVAGVISIQYRQRGFFQDYINMPDTVQVSIRDILRMDNDPSRPERGSLKVIVEGGK